MTRPLLPALIAFAVVSLAGGARAEAQRPLGVTGVNPAPAIEPPVASATTPVAPAPAPMRVLGPTMLPPTPVTVTATHAAETLETGLTAQGARRIPTTRVLIVGGTALAIGGLFIGGDAGAIVSLTGATAAILGLYLHYR